MCDLLAPELSRYRKIAGDRCVPGKENYFFPIIRDCPVKPPRFLVIESSPGTVKTNVSVTFNLRQFDVRTRVCVRKP